MRVSVELFVRIRDGNEAGRAREVLLAQVQGEGDSRLALCQCQNTSTREDRKARNRNGSAQRLDSPGDRPRRGDSADSLQASGATGRRFPFKCQVATFKTGPEPMIISGLANSPRQA